jgi:hypothetical protein
MGVMQIDEFLTRDHCNLYHEAMGIFDITISTALREDGDKGLPVEMHH